MQCNKFLSIVASVLLSLSVCVNVYATILPKAEINFNNKIVTVNNFEVDGSQVKLNDVFKALGYTISSSVSEFKAVLDDDSYVFTEQGAIHNDVVVSMPVSLSSWSVSLSDLSKLGISVKALVVSQQTNQASMNDANTQSGATEILNGKVVPIVSNVTENPYVVSQGSVSSLDATNRMANARVLVDSKADVSFSNRGSFNSGVDLSKFEYTVENTPDGPVQVRKMVFNEADDDPIVMPTPEVPVVTPEPIPTPIENPVVIPTPKPVEPSPTPAPKPVELLPVPTPTPKPVVTPSNTLVVKPNVNNIESQVYPLEGFNFKSVTVNMLPRISVKDAYMIYYNSLIREQEKLISEFSATTYKGEMAQKEIDKLNEKKVKVQAMQASEFSGVVYDVPLYRQYSDPLCWAYSQTMVENANGNAVSQSQAKVRAESLAGNRGSWAGGGFPYGATPMSVPDTIGELMGQMQSVGPVYATYKGYMGSFSSWNDESHLLVVAGVLSGEGLPDLVYVNNPWGQKDFQLFYEFMRNPIGANGMSSSPLNSIHDPNIFSKG